MIYKMKNVVLDIDVLLAHPFRVNELLEKITSELSLLKTEGCELYELVSQKQRECLELMSKIDQEYRNRNMDTFGEGNNLNYRDSNQQDFYEAEIRQQYEELSSKSLLLSKCQRTLEDVESQLFNLYNSTVEVIHASKRWKNAFADIINHLIESK